MTTKEKLKFIVQKKYKLFHVDTLNLYVWLFVIYFLS